MLLTIATLITAGAMLAPAQETEAPRPLVQLIQDLDAATSHASLTNAQKTRLAEDRAVLERARVAKEGGGTVDRRQVSGAVKSIRQTMQDGAFTDRDRQTIAADIDMLRKQ